MRIDIATRDHIKAVISTAHDMLSDRIGVIEGSTELIEMREGLEKYHAVFKPFLSIKLDFKSGDTELPADHHLMTDADLKRYAFAACRNLIKTFTEVLES